MALSELVFVENLSIDLSKVFLVRTKTKQTISIERCFGNINNLSQQWESNYLSPCFSRKIARHFFQDGTFAVLACS